MELVDTHTHLYGEQFSEDRPAMIARALAAGVQRFYLPAIDSGVIDDLLALEAAYPERCFAMMGLHPCSVRENYEEELAIVADWLGRRPFAAVGEIGIDLYWDKTHYEEQRRAFLRQVEWAKELGLPIVIHSRESIDLILDLLEPLAGGALTGIFHCFTGTGEQAARIIDLGFLLGVGGVLTFRNAGLDQTLAAIGLEHVVLETDAPYLAPVPHRGQRNESAYLRLIAGKLAAVKEVSLEEVARITTANADRMFGYEPAGADR